METMTPFDAPASHTHAVRDDRLHSLVSRMLQGRAAASMHAYVLDEWLPFVAHGMTSFGSLAVAAVPSEILSVVPPGFETDVRLDLIKQTPDPAVSILAAAAHVLGRLTWADPAETAGHTASGRLPARVESTLTLPGARLGFVEMDQIVLRDLTGTTAVPIDQLDDLAAPVIEDEHDAFGLVARYDNAMLKDLCWAVLVGRIPGIVIRDTPLLGICEHTADRVFCLDVDPTGVTVMLVGRLETLRVFARFSTPASTQADLDHLIDELIVNAALPA